MSFGMNRRIVLSLLAAVAVSSCATLFHADSKPGAVQAALADSRRTDAERDRDARSKPLEILTFAGVRPGMNVADLVIGGGYYSKILAVAVGPKGHVWSWQPAEFVRFDKSYAEVLTTLPAAYPNLTTTDAGLGALSLPAGKLDLAFTNQNYHDLHLKPFPLDTASKVNAAVFKALKPGGVYVIVDHAANPGGDVTTVAHGLHRIDKEQVKREVTAAGFVFVEESPILANPADLHTANVFDASIRGHTDQFVLKFRKPKR